LEPAPFPLLLMNYEYFFIKNTDRKNPKIVRVLAANLARASAIVSRRFGEDQDIRAIEIENVFGEGQGLDKTRARPKPRMSA